MNLQPYNAACPDLLFANFNQDCKCFVVGTKNGFRQEKRVYSFVLIAPVDMPSSSTGSSTLTLCAKRTPSSTTTRPTREATAMATPGTSSPPRLRPATRRGRWAGDR